MPIRLSGKTLEEQYESKSMSQMEMAIKECFFMSLSPSRKEGSPTLTLMLEAGLMLAAGKTGKASGRL